jgi:cytochrome P450
VSGLGQNVDAPELIRRGLHHGIDLRRVADIAPEGDRDGSPILYFLSDVDQLGLRASDYGDRGTFGGQGEGDSPAGPLASSRHDCHAPIENSHLALEPPLQAVPLIYVPLTLPLILYIAFDELRTNGGIAWHDEAPVAGLMGDNPLLQFVNAPGFWALTSYDLVLEVDRDLERFSSQLGGTFMPSMTEDSLAMFRQMLLNMDNPQHSRLRRIVQPVFTPKSTELLRKSIEDNATEIMTNLPNGEFDLVTSVSAEMPLRVLADLFGMPREDRHLIFEWSNSLLGADNPSASEHAADSVTALAGMMSYGQAMADDRRANPRDDIVSRIVTAEVDGERLSDAEFQMFWLLLVIAGNETTRNAVSGSVVALHQQGLWSWLAEHVDCLPTAVEELLRYVSPVQNFRRTATRDLVLGDQHVRAGDKVVMWFGAANRDPRSSSTPTASTWNGIPTRRSPLAMVRTSVLEPIWPGWR